MSWFATSIIALTFELFFDLLLFAYFVGTVVILGLVIENFVRRVLAAPFTAVAPIIVGALAVWLTWNLPPFERNFYFQLDRWERDRVVAMIESGQLPRDPSFLEFHPSFGEVIRLPFGHEHLSKLKGGDVLVDRLDGVTQIIFLDYVGGLEGFTGYAYRSDDQEPVARRGTTFGPVPSVERLAPHWFFITVDD